MELNLPDLRGLEPEDAKQDLRRIIRSTRQRINDAQVLEMGRGVQQNALDLARGYEKIACYISVNKEPRTLELVENLYQEGKEILVPKLGPALSRAWAKYAGRADLADLSPNRPKEPTGAALECEILSEVDFVITPALAIDRRGNRLGQGGGWYNRALPFLRPHTPIYALCYTHELVSNTLLPIDEYDVPVTGVITQDFCFQLADSQFAREGTLPVSVSD